MKFLVRAGLSLALSVVILLIAAFDVPWSSLVSWPFGGSPPRRLDVYETLIRDIADPKGTKPINVRSALCVDLMRSEDGVRCPDRLTLEEQRALVTRLQDIGEIVFPSDDESASPPEGGFQLILLGPIVEHPDGLRVEVGVVCGNLCGSGSVYRLVDTDEGYEVSVDEEYGHWIS